MTIKEFQKKYLNYFTPDIEEAIRECEKVNKELESSAYGPAVVSFEGGLENTYTLILKSTQEFMDSVRWGNK